jgi:type IV pilus assembly protein PilF
VIPACLRRLPGVAGLLAALAVAACAALPTRQSESVGVGIVAAERPVADRPAANEAETKARAHVDLGAAYLQAGNHGVALDEAKLALDSAPNYAPAYLLVATVYMFLDDKVAARANFEQALQLAPGDPEINNTYGWFLCASGQEQQGLERLAAAMRNPYYRSPARPHANAGLCHLRLKDDAAAETSFQRAVQLDPANSEAYLQLADIAFRRGNYDAARRYIMVLHQLGPTSAASAWLGLRTERRLGNREAAASYAQQLKSRFPTSSEYQLLLQGKID